MNNLIVKSDNGTEILFYYMDENGVEQNVSEIVEDQQAEPQVIEVINEEYTTTPLPSREVWSEQETKRLLVFYIDNKQSFVKGLAKKKDLWNAACRTILPQKTFLGCEGKLHSIKQKYAKMCGSSEVYLSWPFTDLCHQAFFDDPLIISSMNKQATSKDEVTIDKDGIVILKKKIDNNKHVADKKMITMLNLYLAHKKAMNNMPKDLWQRGLWEYVTKKIGEENPDYWHKKFLNFKQNYIRLLDKRKESGPDSITWPYMKYYDEIFQHDVDFQKKFMTNDTIASVVKQKEIVKEPEWDSTEITVLVKYFYDCFSEFYDDTIPNKFLWNEVGRLLDRNPVECENKYKELKEQHLANFNDGSYVLNMRLPLAIIFDNIISKEISIELEKTDAKVDVWSTDEIDQLAQFLYDNQELLKDPICYNVCWARLANKLNTSAYSCKCQWDILVSLYDSILKDKKDNPDLEIDWRYIEIFDRMFDYGMNMALLKKFQANTPKEVVKQELKEKDTVKDDEILSEEDTSGRGDPRAFKILEFYQKHKDSFKSANRNKTSNWQTIANEVNMTATQCAHRFRNLKQVYMTYLNRECKQPDKPIVWPYYDVCKKVFGYRNLKSKISKKTDLDYSIKEWSGKDIKALIEYFSQNFDVVNNDPSNLNHWEELADKICKDSEVCRSKFMELRKSYRKLKTMLSRNPHTKVSWKYFSQFDAIYSYSTEYLDNYEPVELDDDIKQEIQEDDDIQCIIVVPEGQTLEEVIAKQKNAKKKTYLWNNKSKKQLLNLYLNYLKSHKNEIINPKSMWNEIAGQIDNKTVVSCQKMFARLKKRKLENELTGIANKRIHSMLNKILKIVGEKNRAPIKDVSLPDDKVAFILNYYFDNLPKFIGNEAKSSWEELAAKVGLPMKKVSMKVRYLENLFLNKHNRDVKIPHMDILKKIFANKSEAKVKDTGVDNWTDEQIEQLLVWYLGILEKFKNPKLVRSNLWKDVASILGKTAFNCSKKMTEMRNEYRKRVYDSPQELQKWKFADLCQKIYGCGKQIDTMQDDTMKVETMQDDNMQDDAMQDDTMQDDAMQDDTMQDDAMQDDTMQDDAMEDDTMQVAEVNIDNIKIEEVNTPLNIIISVDMPTL